MAILRLRRLVPDAPSPDVDPQALSVVGRCILRRLVEEWPRFDRTFSAIRAELGRAGMDSRGQDTFGIMLACADLVEHEGWPEDEDGQALRLSVPMCDGDLKRISELFAVAGMAEYEGRADNWRRCLSHLFGVRVDAWRSGSRHAVGKVLSDLWHERGDMTVEIARSMLEQVGLGLVARPGPRNFWLAVPVNGPLTRTLFEGSDWAGDVGAGVWTGALRQAPETLFEVKTARVNGDPVASTMISLLGLYGESGVMAGGE